MNYIKAHKEWDVKAAAQEAQHYLDALGSDADTESGGEAAETEYAALSSQWEHIEDKDGNISVRCLINGCDEECIGKTAWKGHVKGDHQRLVFFCKSCQRFSSQRQHVLYHRERQCQADKVTSKPAIDRMIPDEKNFLSEAAIMECVNQTASVCMATCPWMFDQKASILASFHFYC